MNMPCSSASVALLGIDGARLPSSSLQPPSSLCPLPTSTATLSPHYALGGLSPATHPSPIDSSPQRNLVGTSPSESSNSHTTMGTLSSATPAYVSALTTTEPRSSASSPSPLDLSQPHTPEGMTSNSLSLNADHLSLDVCQSRHHTRPSTAASSRSCSPLPNLSNLGKAAGTLIFFYKNQVYKNVRLQIVKNLRTC